VALVLAIEPDQRQASILKRIVREKVHADVVVVDSPDAALAAIRAHVPDVLLLSALLSPRDEDELIGHLRSLDGADHIQTHTIPQLASSGGYQDDQGRKGRGLLGRFKRSKKDVDAPVPGCEPELFAEEILTFLRHAEEKKAEGAALHQSRVNRLEYEVQQAGSANREPSRPAAEERSAEDASAGASSASSWASPFEWRRSPSSPSGPTPESIAAATPEPLAIEPEPPFEPATSYVPSPEFEAVTPEPVAAPEPVYEDPAPVVDIAAAPAEEPVAAAEVTLELPVSEPVHEEVPAAEPPAPKPRRGARPSNGSTIAPATVLRLTPLAMWARAEAQNGTATKPVEEPKTATDELRSLIATLAVPAHVAGVSYGRGCRIRRVRVPGGKERRKTDSAGPVILSRRALEAQRANQ
jgi:hypothetical protein